jgi:hypothetical protein
LTETAREAEMLNFFRRLHPSDQLLAERILREIARTTTGVRSTQHDPQPSS